MSDSNSHLQHKNDEHETINKQIEELFDKGGEITKVSKNERKDNFRLSKSERNAIYNRTL